MKLYAITHGRKATGQNPGLTEQGRTEITELKEKIARLKPSSAVIGTGKRFMETFYVICGAIPEVGYEQIKICPLLGSADSGKKAESGWDVILADGIEVKAGKYIGLIELQKVIDFARMLEVLAEPEALLITGREFIGALMGSADQAKSSAVYEIDTETGAVTEI